MSGLRASRLRSAAWSSAGLKTVTLMFSNSARRLESETSVTMWLTP